MRQVSAIRRNRVYLELVVMETTMQMRAPSKQTSEINGSRCGLSKWNAHLRGKQTWKTDLLSSGVLMISSAK